MLDLTTWAHVCEEGSSKAISPFPSRQEDGELHRAPPASWSPEQLYQVISHKGQLMVSLVTPCNRGGELPELFPGLVEPVIWICPEHWTSNYVLPEQVALVWCLHCTHSYWSRCQKASPLSLTRLTSRPHCLVWPRAWPLSFVFFGMCTCRVVNLGLFCPLQ